MQYNSAEELKQFLLNTKVFIDNEYLDSYIKIIYTNKIYQPKEKYTEKHHILQRSYFKRNKIQVDNSLENIVVLSMKDHILVHYFLCFCTTEGLDYDNSIAFLKLTGYYYKNILYEDLLNIFPKIEEVREKVISITSKPVEIYSKEGVFITSCQNATKAAKYMEELTGEKFRASDINGCCSNKDNKSRTCKNYIFIREEENIQDRINKINIDAYALKKRKIDVYDLKGNFIITCNSIKECAQYMFQLTHETYFAQNITFSAIGKKRNYYKNYIFLYHKDSIESRLQKIQQNQEKEEKRINTLKKKICIYNLDGEVIKQVKSSGEAETFIQKYSNDSKYGRQGISACCAGKHLLYKNYIFLYDDETFENRYKKILENIYSKAKLLKKQEKINNNNRQSAANPVKESSTTIS